MPLTGAGRRRRDRRPLPLGTPLLGPLRNLLEARLPLASVLDPAGDPLDGALLIAARLASGGLRLPEDPALLSVS